jgi:hypothetical protein
MFFSLSDGPLIFVFLYFFCLFGFQISKDLRILLMYKSICLRLCLRGLKVFLTLKKSI